MNEFLLVRLGSRHQDCVYWLVWSVTQQAVISSGQLNSAAQLSELTERAGHRPVIVLVPGCDVIFRELTLPGRLNHQTLRALRFMLEEQIASDVEQLHLVVLEQQGQQVHIAAVEQSQMAQWLSWLANAGLTAQQLLPDVLALPQPTDNEWPLLQLGEQWLIRQSTHDGSVVDGSWLSTWLETQPHRPNLHSYTPAPSTAEPGKWQISLCELPLQLLAEHLPSRQCNLLQGTYRQVAPWQKQWSRWRWPALLAGFWLVLVIGNQSVLYLQTRQQQQQLQQQITTVYRQLFPEEKRVVNPTVQFRQHLAALQQTPLSSSFLNQLSILAPLLHQTPDCVLQQLRFDADKQEFRVQVSAKDLRMLQQLKTQASASFKAEMSDLQEQNGQANGILILRSKS